MKKFGRVQPENEYLNGKEYKWLNYTAKANLKARLIIFLNKYKKIFSSIFLIKSDLSKATHKFYCNRDILDKETRNIFVEGSVNDIMKNRKKLLEYNFDDVYATAEVFAKVFPIYISQYPSPVNLFGTMIMGQVRNQLTNRKFSNFLTPTLSEFEM